VMRKRGKVQGRNPFENPVRSIFYLFG